jgi:hypothetical protein
VMSHRFDVQLLFQSQWPPHALEFVFIDVDHLALTGVGDHWDAVVESVMNATTGERRFVLIADNLLRISTRRVFYRVRDEALGQQTYLSGEVPAPDAIAAIHFEDDWRQCSDCSDTWRESPTVVFARCPSCGQLTEYIC